MLILFEELVNLAQSQKYNGSTIVMLTTLEQFKIKADSGSQGARTRSMAAHA